MGRPAPWLSKDIKRHLNERDKLLRKMRKNKTDENIAAYKRKQNFVNVLLRNVQNKYHCLC